MKLVNDLSNYDADHDANNPNWAAEFIAAGSEGIIVGSQWPEKARRQLTEAKAAGLPIFGTYAEPNSMTAVSLAQEFGARYVGLACEPGSITSYPELAQCVARVRGAGLIPLIYGNQGDLVRIGQGKFGSELLWLANYGTDDPANPRPPITDVDFGGWTTVAVHQYSSAIVIAGRVRDHNYWMVPEEDDLTTEEKQDLAALTAIMGGHAVLQQKQTAGMDFVLGFGMDQARINVLQAAADPATQAAAQQAADDYEAAYKGTA